MNLGNVVELVLLWVFVGPGAYLGQTIVGGWGGAVIGGAVGLLARIAVGLLVGRWPPCACGNAVVERFDLVERARDRPVWKCQQCGKSYVLVRRSWFEVLPDDTRVLRQRQRLLGTWARANGE